MRENNPTVSVIIPIYNAEKYLAEAIESVLNQTYTNFELLLVNDKSTDNSKKICEEYAEKDERIIVIHKPNEGAATARNIGLERASGRYIAFLDGDDYFDEKTIERLYEEIDGSEYDVVVSDFLNILPDEKDNFALNLKDATVSGREVLEHLKNEKNYGVWTVVWNKIFKREVLENLRFPDGKYFIKRWGRNRICLKYVLLWAA